MSTVAPSTQAQPPIINNLRDAISDLDCSLERVRVLFANTTAELHELFDSTSSPEFIKNRGYDLWCIFRVGCEKLEEANLMIGAISEAYCAERREVSK